MYYLFIFRSINLVVGLARFIIRKRALDFELFATITGFRVSKQDTSYRKSTTVSEIALDFFSFSWFVNSTQKYDPFISKPSGQFYVVSTNSRLLDVMLS
jgi:hypothetical protein